MITLPFIRSYTWLRLVERGAFLKQKCAPSGFTVFYAVLRRFYAQLYAVLRRTYAVSPIRTPILLFRQSILSRPPNSLLFALIRGLSFLYVACQHYHQQQSVRQSCSIGFYLQHSLLHGCAYIAEYPSMLGAVCVYM